MAARVEVGGGEREGSGPDLYGGFLGKVKAEQGIQAWIIWVIWVGFVLQEPPWLAWLGPWDN